MCILKSLVEREGLYVLRPISLIPNWLRPMLDRYKVSARLTPCSRRGALHRCYTRSLYRIHLKAREAQAHFFPHIDLLRLVAFAAEFRLEGFVGWLALGSQVHSTCHSPKITNSCKLIPGIEHPRRCWVPDLSYAGLIYRHAGSVLPDYERLPLVSCLCSWERNLRIWARKPTNPHRIADIVNTSGSR
jgi:hypothetical protein